MTTEAGLSGPQRKAAAAAVELSAEGRLSRRELLVLLVGICGSAGAAGAFLATRGDDGGQQALSSGDVPTPPVGELIGDDVAQQLAELDARIGPLHRLQDLRVAVEIWDDFFGSNETTNQIGQLGWRLSTGGGGSSGQPGLQADNGELVISTGTSSVTGFAYIDLSTQTHHGGPVFTSEWRIKLESLNEAGQEFSSFVGLATPMATEPTDGFYFKYTPSEPRWQATTARSSRRSDEPLPVADTAYCRLRITCDGAGTARFYFDDELVATHTTNLPGALQWYSPTAIIAKEGGRGTAKRLFIDYFYLRGETTR